MREELRPFRDIPLSMRRFLSAYLDGIEHVEAVQRVHTARTGNTAVLVGTTVVNPNEDAWRAIYDAQVVAARRYQQNIQPTFIEAQEADMHDDLLDYPELNTFLTDRDAFREIYRRNIPPQA